MPALDKKRGQVDAVQGFPREHGERIGRFNDRAYRAGIVEPRCPRQRIECPCTAYTISKEADRVLNLTVLKRAAGRL